MTPSRLPASTHKLRGFEAVVKHVHSRPKADSLLNLLGRMSRGENSDFERLTLANPDVFRLALHGMSVGAYGCQPQTFSSIHDAVQAMGVVSVNHCVTASAYLLLCVELCRDTHVAPKPFFKHSFVMAKLGEKLTEPHNTGFFSGMLHNIGLPVMASCFADKYSAVHDAALLTGNLPGTEASKLGIDHQTAGLNILIEYGFPNEVCECAALHHKPVNRIPANARINCVVLRLVSEAGISSGVEPLCDPMAETDLQDFGINRSSALECIRQFDSSIKLLAG